MNLSKHLDKEVTVALVGKYTALHDAYISVVESLKHGGFAHNAQVNIKWVNSENVTPENVAEQLADVSGILVPGGFGDRGIDGKIYAIQYAREHNIPFLGIVSRHAAKHCRICQQMSLAGMMHTPQSWIHPPHIR